MTTEAAVAEKGLVVAEDSILSGLQTVKAVIAPDLSDQELQLFAMVSARSGLDPFARQIFAVKRKGKVSFQTGIDGYRSIAARTGEYDGQDEPIFGPDCKCGRPPAKHPESATTRVYRKGVGRAIAATAFWHEYVPGEAFMWEKMPHVMIAKVSEALALRKAFPWDPTRREGIGADIYTTEEMEQAGGPTRPSVQERLAVQASGVSAQEFRELTSDVPREEIEAKAEELFPGIAPRDLTRVQLADLLSAVLSEGSEDEADEGQDGTPPVRQTEEEHPTTAPSTPPEDTPSGARIIEGAVCGVPSIFGEETTCMLAKGHRGMHRAGESESWPR